MEKSISATEANRNFSRLLREVSVGHSYTLTSHGRPVARLVPIVPDAVSNEAKKRELLQYLKRIKSRPIQIIGHWTRDELYEREPRRRRSRANRA